MSQGSELVLRVLAIGVGATLVMDAWALLLKQFNIKSLNFAYLGRWIGHLPQGQWIQKNIANTPAIKGELLIGWSIHYSIGVTFAALLVLVFTDNWVYAPTLGAALVTGIVTAVAPLFVLQPALGAGVASWKTPNPIFNSLKSIVTHTVYGFGLYFTARLTLWLMPH